MSQDKGNKWDKLDIPPTSTTRSTQRQTPRGGGPSDDTGMSHRSAPKATKWSNLEEPVTPKSCNTDKWNDLEVPEVPTKNKWSNLEVPVTPESCNTGKWNDLEVPEGRPERPRKTPLEPLEQNKWSDMPIEYSKRQDRPRNPYGGFGPKQMQSYGPAMRMQDPQHIIGQQAPQTTVLRKNALAASIEQAIIAHKQEPVDKPAAIPIVPLTQRKQQNKKKKQSSLDDLDEDEDERKAIAAAALARMASQEESEDSEGEVEEEGDRPLTKAERKAAKQEAKKKRMIAAGLGHMYDRR